MIEVEPLFSPDPRQGWDTHFICNIGDEISLWYVAGALRIYGADAYGIWAGTLGPKNMLIDRMGTINLYYSATLEAVIRNYDAVMVYVRMLGAQK